METYVRFPKFIKSKRKLDSRDVQKQIDIMNFIIISQKIKNAIAQDKKIINIKFRDLISIIDCYALIKFIESIHDYLPNENYTIIFSDNRDLIMQLKFEVIKNK